MAFLLSTILISSLNAQLNCIEAPKDASCSLYKYPDSNSTQDTASLCSQMSFMVGCSVQKSCKSSTIGFCAPFSILGDICDGDMPRMKACKSYTSLCEITGTGDQATPSSPPIVGVQQCSSQPPIPSLPSSLLASQKIKSICSEMNMVGCDRCKDTGSTYMNCDLLDTYSYLCKAMPNMNQCAEWKQMCSLTPSLPFCSQDAATSPDSPPTMKMFFHTGLADYVLFEEWVPRTVLQYIGTVIALFFLCVFYEFLLAYHTVMEASWTMNKAALCFPYKLPGGQELNGQYRILAFRFTMKFLTATLGYALMLVTMTFNVGLYFTVVLGLSVGYVAFAGLAKRALTISGDEKAVKIDPCC